METAEAMALLTVGAGILPALSSRGWWLAGLTVLTIGLLIGATWICLDESHGLAGLLCIIALIAGGVLAAASFVLGIVRWNYRRRGAQTALGNPWVVGPVLYILAVLGFAGFIGVISG